MLGTLGGRLVRITNGALAVGLIWSASLPRPAFADGAWLDDTSVTWNTPGMPLPRPREHQDGAHAEPRCAEQARPSDIDADRAAMNAGWPLLAGYTGGWGVQIVRGLARPVFLREGASTRPTSAAANPSAAQPAAPGAIVPAPVQVPQAR